MSAHEAAQEPGIGTLIEGPSVRKDSRETRQAMPKWLQEKMEVNFEAEKRDGRRDK